MNNLVKIKNRLADLSLKYTEKNYGIPSFWLSGTNTYGKITVEPFSFFLSKINEIENLSRYSPEPKPIKNWSEQAVVYNMLVRHATAFDHDDDGKIRIDLLYSGLRETGTFLKCIALLPYIFSLGVNTIHLLPVAETGTDGMKGSLGSPYSIKNPYKISEQLLEPILEMCADIQFAAFIEAAHLLGMKVIVEFVFRTASLDSELSLKHPDWFYWIRDEIEQNEPGTTDESKYSQPFFTEEELAIIKEKVETSDFSLLPWPHKIYRDFFTSPPVEVWIENGKIKGRTSNGLKCKIPGAFADWPPDDKQPVWSDVTYLKLFDHQNFNYIAYNTVRMYDSRLESPNNKINSLWDHIGNIIPYHQEKFAIDGVMVDMGHALPGDLMNEIVGKAREKDTEFIFWEENFTLSENSVKQGYDAVIGYLPFDQHVNWKLKSLIRMLSENTSPLPFFLTPESHNTPRAATKPGGIEYSKFAYTINSFLPGILFIHAGFELGETIPVNTGLCFGKGESEKYPAEILPLFSPAALDWEKQENLVDYIHKINQIKKELDIEGKVKIDVIFIDDDDILSFVAKYENCSILIIGNMNSVQDKAVNIDIPFEYKYFLDLVNAEKIYNENISLEMELKSFGIKLFQIYF